MSDEPELDKYQAREANLRDLIKLRDKAKASWADGPWETMRPQPNDDATSNTRDLLERLEASQKACFDAGLHIAAMDIQTARAQILILSRGSLSHE